MAPLAAMVKTLTSALNNRERGIALLEAAMALALVSLITAATYSIFSQSAASTARSEAKLQALTQVETALEMASTPAFLERTLAEGQASLEGEGWRVRGDVYDEDGRSGPLALVRLRASAGPENAPTVELETLRALPK